MDATRPLRGGCSCGRNQYHIHISSPSSEEVQVLFDDSGLGVVREGQTLSLRVPLSVIRSTTHAYYDDETPQSIRRAFTPRHAPHTKRHFCGFCGTPLSHWSEEDREEAEWICVNIGSLRNESVERLEEAGLLTTSPEEEERQAKSAPPPNETRAQRAVTRTEGREVRVVPWFEEMIQGSDMGRIKRRRGGETSVDGKSRVEWEVVEIGGDEGAGVVSSTAKRKISTVTGVGDGEGGDVHMRG